MIVSHKAIAPIRFGGAGAGNAYNFEVTRGDMVTLAHGERDVAYAYEQAGLLVPQDLAGPYDCYGRTAR